MPNSESISKGLSANEKARQRQIWKDKRRKEYEDIQIQGTNNSSIVSKRSVEMLYTTKLNPQMGEWFKHFVKQPKRRSPAINRGYWIRMESIKRLVLNVIHENQGKRISIVNLGCGFDPFPFQLLNEFRNMKKPFEKLHFIDIDYPDLVANKSEMIQQSQECMNLIGQFHNKIHESVVISSENYSLIGCNLRNLQLFNDLMQKVNSADVTIFIAEVSLAYMKPEHSDPVIENASKYPNSHFIILEQLLPVGSSYPFAQKMIHHFDHLRSPLGCITKYPTLQDQIQRFSKYFPKVYGHDLMYHWKYSIDTVSKIQISQIETFDEWEEFIIFCQHYCIIYSTNSEIVKNNQVIVPQLPNLAQNSKFIGQPSTFNLELKLKFPGVAKYGDSIYIFGGSGQQRSNDIYKLHQESLVKLEVLGTIPSARMAHTFTTLGNKAISIGGRSRPGNEFSSIDEFDFTTNTWTFKTDIGQKMARHSAVAISHHQLIVFHQGIFRLYDNITNEVHILSSNMEIPVLHSTGMCYDIETNTGYIVGGIISPFEPQVSQTVYKFRLNSNNRSIVVEKMFDDPLLQLIGCQCSIINKDFLVIIPSTNFNQVLNYAITIDLQTNKFEKIPLNEMLIGFGLVTSESQLEMIAGGGVCYSFGSYYNERSRVNYLT